MDDIATKIHGGTYCSRSGKWMDDIATKIYGGTYCSRSGKG
jgi:hypothetical protein